MSKSYGNYIALLDSPEDMYGKVMSIPDTLITKYFELATDISMEEVKKIISDPMGAKKRLAREIVTFYHSAKDAEKAEENFVKVFSEKEIPEEVREVKVKSKNILDVLVETGLCSSKSDARRNVEQGGIKVDGKVMKDPKVEIKLSDDGVLMQKGKRHFVKVKI
jgi:tyrosyl-tRNA synthetase